MPELPEIETIRQRLRNGDERYPSILGKQITGAIILWERSIAIPSVQEFVELITGELIEEVNRRGKYFVFKLVNQFLLIHLRMSGDLFLESQDEFSSKYYRIIFNMNDGNKLSFTDTRKFGKVWLVNDPEEVIGSLGPEPLSDEFNVEDLYQGLKKHHRQLKPLLLDQTFLAGLGNIYTDEALHVAKLHPLTLSNTITYDQAKSLWHAIRKILQKGIRNNGASIDWVFRGGNYQNHFLVYQRKDEACYHCGATIQKIKVGQRGTHICPVCQPYPK